jgi:hypothetical protein
VPRISALRHVQKFIGQHSLYHAVSSHEVIGVQLLVFGHRVEVSPYLVLVNPCGDNSKRVDTDLEVGHLSGRLTFS